jgi:ABC-type multidrug transport system fused ATPase/permease subunit
MEKQKVLNFLNKYNFNYSEKNNSIFVKLELAQQIRIEFDEPNKIIIKDKLIGWNFLTGMIEMSLKNAFIYNFVGTILLGILCLYSENKHNGMNLIGMFLVFTTWIILFSGFYIVKLESFKNQLMNWTKE